MDKAIKHVRMPDAEIQQILETMEEDAGLKTERGYADALFPANIVSFSEKHLAYLQAHPKLNVKSYLTNLRTMIKIRK